MCNSASGGPKSALRTHVDTQVQRYNVNSCLPLLARKPKAQTTLRTIRSRAGSRGLSTFIGGNLIGSMRKAMMLYRLHPFSVSAARARTAFIVNSYPATTVRRVSNNSETSTLERCRSGASFLLLSPQTWRGHAPTRCYLIVHANGGLAITLGCLLLSLRRQVLRVPTTACWCLHATPNPWMQSLRSQLSRQNIAPRHTSMVIFEPPSFESMRSAALVAARTTCAAVFHHARVDNQLQCATRTHGKSDGAQSMWADGL